MRRRQALERAKTRRLGPGRGEEGPQNTHVTTSVLVPGEEREEMGVRGRGGRRLKGIPCPNLGRAQAHLPLFLRFLVILGGL